MNIQKLQAIRKAKALNISSPYALTETIAEVTVGKDADYLPLGHDQNPMPHSDVLAVKAGNETEMVFVKRQSFMDPAKAKGKKFRIGLYTVQQDFDREIEDEDGSTRHVHLEEGDTQVYAEALS